MDSTTQYDEEADEFVEFDASQGQRVASESAQEIVEADYFSSPSASMKTGTPLAMNRVLEEEYDMEMQDITDHN